jgi:hypothetical protein
MPTVRRPWGWIQCANFVLTGMLMMVWQPVDFACARTEDVDDLSTEP